MLFTHVFAVSFWVWLGQWQSDAKMIDFVSVILSFLFCFFFASFAPYSFSYFCNLRNRLFFSKFK